MTCPKNSNSDSFKDKIQIRFLILLMLVITRTQELRQEVIDLSRKLLLTTDINSCTNYRVVPEHGCRMLELLDELVTQQMENPTTVTAHQFHIHCLLDWLLQSREGQNRIQILSQNFTLLKVGAGSRFPKDRSLHEFTTPGFISECPTMPNGHNHRQNAAICWAFDFPKLAINNYFECPTTVVDLYLGYLKAFLEHAEKNALAFLRAIARVLDEKPDAEQVARGQCLIKEIPWWRYNLCSFLYPPAAKDKVIRVTLNDLFVIQTTGDYAISPLMVSLLGMESDALTMTLNAFRHLDFTERPLIPRFNPQEAKFYPFQFAPTMKTLFLAWNHLRLPKDLARYKIVDYVLWNSFQERDPLVIELEKELRHTYGTPKAHFHKELLRAHLLPSTYIKQDIHDGGHFALAVANAQLPYTPAGRKILELYILGNFSICTGDSPGSLVFISDSVLAKQTHAEIIAKFRCQYYRLKMANRGHGFYTQNTSTYAVNCLHLENDRGQPLCTIDDLISWMVFDPQWYKPP